MNSAVTNSTAQQLYSTAHTSPAKTAQAPKPANEEASESGAERAKEMGKGEEIDTYA